MDETQNFRLEGAANIEKIAFENVDGRSVIYWEDIEQVFPGVKHVKCNGVAVNLLRDSNRKRMTPHCIKYHPGTVLDIVLSSSGENVSADADQIKDVVGDPTEDVVANLQVPSLGSAFNNDNNHDPRSLYSMTHERNPPSDVKGNNKTILSSKRVIELVRTLSMGSKFEQQVVSSRPTDLQIQASTSLESFIQAVGNNLVHRSDEQLAALHELKDNMLEIKDTTSMILALAFENKELTARVYELQKTLDAKTEEMKQLQIQALDRLALLQNSVKALLTQTYELHEYPIPRLFIVLPQDSSSWNPLDFFSNKFHLFFLCECGEHTKATTNSKIPHHIHLAKHEGYEIDRPNEFFQQYGSYVLTILKMLKYGITAAGIAVPALSHLIRVDALDQATVSLKLLTNTIEPGVNQIISHIEKVSADDGGVVVEVGQQMENNEALEGADLRQLETFLKNKDNNRVLGNLYRTVTVEGHVKWVCLDHFRENYHEKAAEAFRNTVKALHGEFDENTGRAEVTLRSRLQAVQFHLALEKARSVYELKVELDWETSQSDFKKLRDTLAITNIGVLELHLTQQDVPTRDILNRNQRFDPVLDIMRHRSIQSFTIRGPCDFTKRSSLLSYNYEFSNLRHLGIPLYPWRDDLPGFKRLITKVPNLSSLTLGTGPLGSGNGYVMEAYKAITEDRTFSINFKEWNLCIPPPPLKESNQSMTAQQSMEQLLKVYCESTSPTLNVDRLDESTANTITEATTNGFAFTGLHLSQASKLSDPFINDISSIVARSELSEIVFYTRKDAGRVRILESIQWKHLRNLGICLQPGTETSVMRTLVDGVTKMSEKVELEKFRLEPETWRNDLTLIEIDLLRNFLSSTSIKDLRLDVKITLEQILSLCGSTDFSRLEHFKLHAMGFDSAQVDTILDALQHATKLKK
ncbi:hypothetical protein BGX34_003633, partial [Mortierella sp. NVP85]